MSADIKALEERCVMRFEARGDMYQCDADGEWVRYRDHSNALASAIAERDEARDRVDELERNAEVVSSEFEGDCWKAVRRLLDECNFDWRGVEDSEGVSADTAEEHIKTTLDELERDAARLRARAETAEARLEELTRERDEARSQFVASAAECDPNCDDPHCPYMHVPVTWQQRALIAEECVNTVEIKAEALTARLEEAKAVLGRITEHRMQDDTVLEAVRGLSIVQEMARAFLHQGGSDAR